MDTTMKVWNPVLDIPEGKSGEFEIQHEILPPGSSLPTASMRTGFFGGHKNAEIVFGDETRWHKLLEDGAVWMSDVPIEQAQHDAHLEGFAGRVLVGGLGLGYAATVLCQREEVTEVVVVEISKDVINLVAPHIDHPKLDVIHMDLFEFLETEDSFDWAFYDIWRSDGEGTFLNMVVPLRGLSKGKVPEENIICWNEDIMRGQLAFSLQSRMHVTMMKDCSMTIDDLCVRQEGRGSQYLNWSLEFFRALRDERFDTTNDDVAMKFAQLYGCPGWLKKWETFLDEIA